MISTKLLNGNIISRDADFSKYIETVSEPGVIKGFVVSATKVGIGMARVLVSRSNGESFYVLVISDSETSISGDGDVYINIPQEIIDNGEIANEDGTGIATIEVGTMPSKNALKLATISNGAVTDERNILKKVSDLEPLISALDERTTTLEEEVGEILDKGAIDHLEESGLVGEKYTLANTLFKQITPTFANSTVDSNIGDTDANKQIHIQRLGTGTASNKLKLKAKKIGAPTTGLVVEVRRGVQVDVSDTEAYWYGNELVCSGSIPYSSISTDYQEFEVTMNGQFGGTKGEKLDIVVYQTGNIVNSTNYYAIACDSTQYSEGFSLVAVNGTTRTRSKLMPYCIADGFAQSMVCKVGTPTRFDVNGSENIVKEQSDFWTPGTYVDYLVYKNDSLYDEIVNGEALYTGTDYKAAKLRRCVDSGTENQINAFNQSAPVAFGPITVPAGSTLYIRFRSWGNNESRRVNTAYVKIVINRTSFLIPKNSNTNGLPREIKETGELLKTTIWGLHNNNEFYAQSPTTSVTTGNITPGNFVGYLQLGNYKIPYYS